MIEKLLIFNLFQSKVMSADQNSVFFVLFLSFLTTYIRWFCFNFFCVFFFDTGAKPVFPGGKSDKEKPKFAVKGHKETAEYPFNKHADIAMFFYTSTRKKNSLQTINKLSIIFAIIILAVKSGE